MIVVDSSALVAILKQEDEAELFIEKLGDSTEVLIGAPTKFELMLVMARWNEGPAVEAALALLVAVNAEVVAWDDHMTDLAIQAEFNFGKGRHPAALNYGDCMAYALAKSLNAPLLFKGNDFALTDVRSAL